MKPSSATDYETIIRELRDHGSQSGTYPTDFDAGLMNRAAEALQTLRSETVTNERRILTKDCRIGATIIRAGCHWDTVIGRAEREYEYHAKNAAPDAEAASGREVPAAAPVAAPDRCKHGVWAADHCWECDPHPNTSRSATATNDPGTEKMLRDMLDRAYKMMQMAGYRVAEQNPDHNNPIIAWMADARSVLYGGTKPHPDPENLT